MIVYLFGPDSYRRQQKLNEIVRNYQEKHSVFTIDYFNLENPDEFFRLKDFCLQQSIFDFKKLAVVKNIFDLNGDLLKELKILFKNGAKSENLIFIVSEEKETPKDFEFLFEKPAKGVARGEPRPNGREARQRRPVIYQEFKNLSGEKLEFFVNKEAKERKLNLTPAAARLLAMLFQGDAWGLITELEKLEFLSRDGQIIEINDLGKVISYFEEPNIFNFIDAVSKNKNISQKIPALENLFINKEEPAKVFNIFASRQFLSFETTKSLADCDVLIKSGKTDYETALFDLCLN